MPVKFLSSPRRAFLYSPFGSRCFGDVERSIDEHFAELPFWHEPTGDSLSGRKRRDERHEHDQSGSTISLATSRDSPNVLHPVCLGESEILVQSVADIVAIEQIRMPTHRVELSLRRRWRSSTCRTLTIR